MEAGHKYIRTYIHTYIDDATYIFGSSMIGHQRERQLVALSLVSPPRRPRWRGSLVRGRRPG